MSEEQQVQADLRDPEVLLERTQRRVYGVVYRMTGAHADVEDLCQEALLRVLQSADRLPPDGDLEAWATRIAVHVSVDYLRRRSRSQASQEQTARAPASDEGRVEARELADAVTEALDQLPPEQRAVLVLRTWEGLSHEAIAELEDVAPATVRWRLFAARRKLERLLAPFL